MDVTGKLVTRHVREAKGTPAASRAKLMGAKPTAAKPAPFKKHFSEFDPHAPFRNDYTPPTSEDTHEGMTRSTVGSKYKGMRDVADIKKDVVNDLKEAVDAGYLPDGLKVRLRTSRAARVQSLAAQVDGLPDSLIYVPGEKNKWGGPQPSELANVIQDRVNNIVGAYDSSYTDYQSDGGGNVYYFTTSIIDEEQREWELQQAADRRRARELKIEQSLA